MKKYLRIFLAAIAVFVLSAMEASAQKLSAAVVDQHYAAQTANYKLMMVALVGVYALYLAVRYQRKKEVDRIMGRL